MALPTNDKPMETSLKMSKSIPQFAHIEAYSFAGSKSKQPIRAILGEAGRIKGYCRHVLTPLEPLWLLSEGTDSVTGAIRAKTALSRERIGRKPDKRNLVLLAGVASFPDPIETLADDPQAFARYERWQGLVLDWLADEYGESLVAACRHDDESRGHIHFFAVPAVHANGAFSCSDGLHPGIAARQAAAANGAKGPEMRAAYKRAMSQFQARFHAGVGSKMGWTIRSDNPRKRLSEEEYDRKMKIERLKAELETLENLEKNRKSKIDFSL